MVSSTFCLANAGQAAPATQATELKQVQQEISKAQQQLRAQQQSNINVQKNIQQLQSQISSQEVALNKVNKTQAGYWQDLQKLQKNNQALQTKLNNSKAQVSRLLNSHYKNKQPDALILLVKNSEPNQKGRQLQYVRYIQNANQKAIQDLLAEQKTVLAQEKQINAQLNKIKSLQSEQKTLLAQLQNKNSQAAQKSSQLQKDIATQTKNIATLKQDEKRLNHVIADIARKSAEKARKQAQERERNRLAQVQKQQQAQAALLKKQQQAAAQKQKKPTQTAQAPTKTQVENTKTPTIDNSHGLTAEDMALAPSHGKAIVVAQEQNSFSRLQGKMRLPMSGTIAARFGQSKSSGGAWRGIYIAGQGSVKAVAAGDVAFAGHLPGYGSTVIIDHGGQYLTVYTGLSNIAVSNAQKISASQSIGSSGQLPDEEKGVYFEIRYRGQAMNPLSWVR